MLHEVKASASPKTAKGIFEQGFFPLTALVSLFFLYLGQENASVLANKGVGKEADDTCGVIYTKSIIIYIICSLKKSKRAT